MLTLNAAEIEVLLSALNDHESRLGTDYLQADQAGSVAMRRKVADDLCEVRRIAGLLLVAKRGLQDQATADLLDNPNYVGSRHHY